MNKHSDMDLTNNLMELYQPRKGNPNRFNVSDIWAILNGYCTPEEYLQGKPIDFSSAIRMWRGTAKHEQIQKLLKGYECEVKKEYQADGFTIVGKVDAINADEILEIKTSEQVMAKSKRWHDFQGKMYCTMFERPKCRIVQPVIKNNKLLLKVVGEVSRDDDWFAKQVKLLTEFHKNI